MGVEMKLKHTRSRKAHSKTINNRNFEEQNDRKKQSACGRRMNGMAGVGEEWAGGGGARTGGSSVADWFVGIEVPRSADFYRQFSALFEAGPSLATRGDRPLA
jgi:hypothetical protein